MRPFFDLSSRPLDIIPRQDHPSLSAQHRQQHHAALVWAHAGVEPIEAAQRTADHLHRIPRHELALGKLDQPVTLAAADLGDDVIGNACRADAVHNQPGDAERPARSVPLLLDHHERVAGKQRRPHLDLAAVRNPALTQAGR
jgi:hypothetical protein